MSQMEGSCTGFMHVSGLCGCAASSVMADLPGSLAGGVIRATTHYCCVLQPSGYIIVRWLVASRPCSPPPLLPTGAQPRPAVRTACLQVPAGT
jgi:hypothetical protein